MWTQITPPANIKTDYGSKHTERETDRLNHQQTYRETDRLHHQQTYRETDGWTDYTTSKHTERETDGQITAAYRKRHRQTDHTSSKHIKRETDRLQVTFFLPSNYTSSKHTKRRQKDILHQQQTYKKRHRHTTTHFFPAISRKPYPPLLFWYHRATGVNKVVFK